MTLGRVTSLYGRQPERTCHSRRDDRSKRGRHKAHCNANRKSHMMHKARKNRRLTERETAVNKAISKLRYAVERKFGSMHRWFGAGIAKYVGLAKTHAQHIMEAIAYNLYRAPEIIVSNCIIKERYGLGKLRQIAYLRIYTSCD